MNHRLIAAQGTMACSGGSADRGVAALFRPETKARVRIGRNLREHRFSCELQSAGETI